MEVNARVKKVIAVMAVIDHTQQDIRRVRNSFEDQIRALKSQMTEQTTALETELNDQLRALDSLLPVSALSRDVELVRNARARIMPKKTLNVFDTIKENALLYIGQQIVHPEHEV